jgi:uncharacterized protein (TIGR03435 family)
VLGWLRPVLVLPIAALAALTPEQVEAILAHELAHVRRHDFVVNLLQTLVEIVLFYHPAVWWISRRIRIEREHCCDMVAVSLCDDPVAYCQALTDLESHRASRHVLALGATDGSLLERVRRVLGEPPRREAWSGRVSSAALIAGVLLVAAGGASYLGAAQPADTRSSGSAPRSASALPWRVVIGYPGGEYRLIGYGGRALIAMAYGNAEARVLGGHRWIDDEPLELTLRAGTRPDDDQLSALLRRELDTRLSLRAHRGRRDFPAFALVSLNGPGRNLRPATRECFDVEEWAASGAPTVDLPFGQRTTICRAWDSGLTRGSVASATMASFTRDLRHTFADAFGERDLIDRTGLSGTYDIDLEFFLPAIALMRWSPVADTALYLAGFRDLPDVLEDQLGLAIEETTAPYDVVVIDHVERPTRR